MSYKYLFMRFPEGKFKAVTFSYDDGVRQDERLIEIFDKYGVKGTFNINSRIMGDADHVGRWSPEELKAKIIDRGHEVATHGATHRAPGKQRAIDVIRDTLDCRIDLEKMTGGIIRGMAYPDSGIHSFSHNGTDYEKIKELLQDLGIAYARTLAGDNDGFEIPRDFYAWTPSAHHNNKQIFEYIDKFLAASEKTYYFSSGMPRLFYVWGHSYEFDRDNNWDRIEEICSKLGGMCDTWYATNIEICDYVKAFDSLIFSADGSRVYNPTLKTVWFAADGRPYSVEPGQTIEIK